LFVESRRTLEPVCSLSQGRFEMKHVAAQAFELDLVDLAV
jgi:hypothetical protein